MKTTWKWSLESEANRILQACSHVANGFFQANNFPILPYESKDQLLEYAVYLPRLNYNAIPDFWQIVSKYKSEILPILDPAGLSSAISSQLSNLNLIDPTNPSVVKLWDQHQDNILDIIYQIFPSMQDHISNITAYPTRFGTNTSFNTPHTFPSNITIFIREDSNIYAIVESILTALTRIDAYTNFSANWGESELLVDYLLVNSPLAEYLNNITTHTNLGTIPSTHKAHTQEVLSTSQSFLISIGAPILDHPFAIQGSQITFKNSPLNHLTDRETTILARLIHASPNLLTYDQLADLIFTSDDDYSLQTISKVIERLRNKLSKQGISSSYLQTVRNQGFYLRN